MRGVAGGREAMLMFSSPQQRTGIAAAITLTLAVLAGGYVARHYLAARSHLHNRPEIPDVPDSRAPDALERRALPADRSYSLAAAEVVAASAARPLLIIIHGDGGNAESMQTFTAFERAVGAGAWVAYAQSKERLWGVHTGATKGELAYLNALATDAATVRAVVPQRIFVFGWSSGAYLAQAYACANPRVAAVALSGAKSAYPCAAAKPTLVLHGTADTEHPVALGDRLAADLRIRNGCTNQSTPTLLPPCAAFSSCLTPLSYCRVDGSGHFPWKSAARVSWRFFSEVP
jgi:poly(3-hydroxybutyrate) depolymerase